MEKSKEKENKEISKQLNEVFSRKPGFFEKWKYRTEFTLLDIKYWMMYKFNIRRSRHLWRLRLHGFHPIMFTEMVMEDTWIFETQEEATKAYNKLERDESEKWIGKLQGWWYGIDDFNKESLESKKWTAGINDRFWIKKGYGLDVSEGCVQIFRSGNIDNSMFVPLTNAKL